MGTKEMSSTAGACVPVPFTATMKPNVAASEYAGAVEATPITTFERKPIAFFFRPLSITGSCARTGAPGAPGTATLSVAMFSLSSSGRSCDASEKHKLRPVRSGAQGAQSPKWRLDLVPSVQGGPDFLTKHAP